MANIMMDIETLGTNFNAVVLQITMVKFNWDKSITSRITVNISIEEQLIKGRTIDESTVNWWKEQKSDVFESCIKEQKKPLEALNELKRFVNYDDIEKIRTLRNDYIISGNEKNKIFMQYNQTKEMKDRFNELHMKQNDIINEISIYETWLKQFEDKIS